MDASKYGLASMLTQLDPETGKHKVVRYDSRATITLESRYAQIELESAAVEFAIKRNYIYLYGLTDFTVITDHKPLLALYNSYTVPTCRQEYTDRSSTYKVTTSN